MKYDPITHLPVSEAITADDLLAEVEQVITDEPLRYDQEFWEQKARGDRYTTKRFPACGTICCVNGWNLLMRKIDINNLNWFSITGAGAKLLGVTTEQASELFDADTISSLAFELEGEGKRSELLGVPHAGTPDYAALGVERIRRFRARYADQLKARILPPLGQLEGETMEDPEQGQGGYGV